MKTGTVIGCQERKGIEGSRVRGESEERKSSEMIRGEEKGKGKGRQRLE